MFSLWILPAQVEEGLVELDHPAPLTTHSGRHSYRLIILQDTFIQEIIVNIVKIIK